MKCKKEGMHYYMFSGETSAFVTCTHNFSALLEKKKNIKSYLDKFKRYGKPERTRQSEKPFLPWVGEIHDYPYGCCSTDGN